MAEKATISFRIDKQKQLALDHIASRSARDRSFIINEALENYIELDEWQTSHIEKGLMQANQGKFASDRKINNLLKKIRKK